jgi:hypothetical protein
MNRSVHTSSLLTRAGQDSKDTPLRTARRQQDEPHSGEQIRVPYSRAGVAWRIKDIIRAHLESRKGMGEGDGCRSCSERAIQKNWVDQFAIIHLRSQG